MRTMLISLILFCSLTQLAIASAPVLVVHDSLKGCGDLGAQHIYECYMPEVCTNAAIAGQAVTAGKVTKVKEDTPVFDKCPALIRFHQYSDLRVFVAIESFKEISEINSIEFVQKYLHNGESKIKNGFSCKIDDANNPIQRGRYFFTTNQRNDQGKLELLTKLKNEEEKSASNLMCTFEVKKNRGDGGAKFFNGAPTDTIHFVVKTDKTIDVRNYIIDSVKCDPAKFQFNNQESKTTLNAKVLYKPGEFYCAKADIYKIEYRAAITDDYKPAAITCDDGQFQINGIDFHGAEIDARCAAKAHFFCDYDVKVKAGNPAPTRVKPDVATNKPSSMKCEGEKKHLIVDEKPILNAKFECVHYGGGDPRWTVIADQYSKILSKTGPEVYCTDKLKCEQIRRIPDGSVEKGLLVDLLPKCHDRGTMKVGGKQIKYTKCDEKTGDYKYKYIDEDGEHLVDENTRFVCEYPTEYQNDVEQNIKNVEKIWKSTVAIGAGLIGLAAACVGAFCLFTCLRLKRDKKRMEAYNQAAYLKYCATDEERAAYKKKHNLKSDVSDQEPVQTWTWNPMMMFWQHRFKSKLAHDDSNGKFDSEGEKKQLEIQSKKLTSQHAINQRGEPTNERSNHHPTVSSDYDWVFAKGINTSNADRAAKKAAEDKKKDDLKKKQ